MSFPAISFDGAVGAECPKIDDEITAMTGAGAEARPRRARVSSRHTEIGGGLSVSWKISYTFVQEPGEGRMTSLATDTDEGIVWMRGWGEEIDTVLRAAYVLRDDPVSTTTPVSNVGGNYNYRNWSGFSYP